jgi:hypothetical protein
METFARQQMAQQLQNSANLNADNNEGNQPVNPSNRLSYEQLQERRNKQNQPQAADKPSSSEASGKGKDNKLDPHASIASAAAAEDLGDNFQYVIEDKVSLPRQQSALLPIVDKPITAERVSIFNESVHGKFPMLGLRFKNTTGLPLAQGAVTVFDEGSYAGDARLPDLQPNEERLLSYAVDLGTEVKAEDRVTPGPQVTLQFGRQVLRSRFTLQMTRTYTIKNRSPQARKVVIEHPIRPEWKLAGANKPREYSRDFYRFEVAVPAGDSVKYDVAEEQQRVEPLATRAVAQNAPDQGQAFDTGLGLDVRQVTKASPPELLGVKVVKGAVHATNRQREARTYRMTNRSDQGREVTLEHSVRPEWKYVGGEQPAAGTTDLYRFRVKLDKGQSAEQEVVEERQVTTQEGALALADATVKAYLENPAVSPAVKAAVRQVAARKAALAELQAQVEELTKEQPALAAELGRLQESLKVIPKDSEPYKEFLAKLGKVQRESETARDQIKEKTAAQKRQKKELDEYVETLTVE